MICDKCGHATCVLTTRDILTVKTARRRECLSCGHRFNTIEVHTRAVKSGLATGFAVTVARNLAFRKRDIDICQQLHLGWQHLAQKYNLSKSAIYLAARRGRNHLSNERKS